jgi:predicted HD superfamily hydrolase involved in NAD metabolism
MARILFGIEDEEILKAIECHTAGKAKMTRFEKILFLADFIDPSRTYKGVSAIRKKALKNLEEAIMECVSFTVIDLAKRGKSIAPNTFETYNDIVSELEKQKTKGDFYGKNI